MSGYGESIRHNLRSLTRLSGRDRRSQFWPYAATVVILSMVVDWVVMIPLTMAGFVQVQNAEAAGAVPNAALQADKFLLATAAWLILIVALLAAAIVRRLHDRGMRGWWGLLPLPFVVMGLVGMGVFIHEFDTRLPDMRIFFAIFFNNMIYIVTLVFLVIHLALKGAAGMNRFGEAPPA
jgi:uncharacterized membrane protein YhaH (DUF805 family)